MLRALIWDVDGTLAETERDGHRVAFNEAFEAHDLSWRWDVPTYEDLLKVAGGFERLLHDLRGRTEAPTSDEARIALARSLHRWKNRRYAELVAEGGIALRPGVRRLIEACAAASIVQAIATTTSRANVDALLHASFGAGWAARFGAVLCAEDAPAKKPDPLVYRMTLERLAVDAAEALAIEDSPAGMAAARAAGVAPVITRSASFHEAVFDDAAALCENLDSTVTWGDEQADRVDVPVLRRILDAARDR